MNNFQKEEIKGESILLREALIDLFSFYILLSHFRPYDGPMGIFLLFFINYAYMCTCIRRHLEETIPSSSITWSEMGKQNIQAKEVYLVI